MRSVLAAGAAVLVASSFLPAATTAAAEPFVPVLAYADQDRLVAVDAVGATEVLSDIDGLYYGAVAYSPDGTKLAFTAHTGSSVGPSLYVMPADGSAAPEVIVERTAGFRWSPDSARIAYGAPVPPPPAGAADLVADESIAPPEDLGADLRIVGADGEDDRLLVGYDDAAFGVDPGCDFLSNRRIFPWSWSPDGSVIAAVS